ncbi:MAG: hypothetical protein ACM3IJ_05195 [Candidatus Levyibacteriota bacterium]
MQLILPIIVIGVIAVLSVFVPKKNIIPKKTDQKVLSTTTVQATPTPTVPAQTSPSIHVSISAGTPSATTVLPSPTSVPSATSTSDFIYPGSKILSPENGEMKLQTTDDPATVTNWYKNRIKENGMNTTSFVTTITNGNVDNVLAGAKNGSQIKITITKSPGQNTVLISISGNSS